MSKDKNIFITDLLGHLDGYSKFGKQYISLFYHFNQFAAKDIVFHFHNIPSHIVTKSDAEKVIKDWSLMGAAAEAWIGKIGSSRAYQKNVTVKEFDQSEEQEVKKKVKRFYDELWKAEKHKHLSEYNAFIKSETDFLKENFDLHIKNEFEYKFKPFFAYLESQKSIKTKGKHIALTFSDMIPETITHNKAEHKITKKGLKYILEYPDTSPAALAALSVALNLQKSYGETEIYNALQSHYNMGHTLTNFKNHLRIFEEVKSNIDLKRYKILQKIIGAVM